MRTLTQRYEADNDLCQISGGYDVKVTPLPIPNRMVKLHCAESTAGEALWQGRLLPGFKLGSLAQLVRATGS